MNNVYKCVSVRTCNEGLNVNENKAECDTLVSCIIEDYIV